MQAVIIDKSCDISIAEVPDPTPMPNEVVVAVRACGICGTDLHLADGDFSGGRYPLIPGHEFAGEVVAVGSEVSGIRSGMMLTADPNCPCGHCRLCREGHGNLCENLAALGVTISGACAEYVVVPARNARRVPEGVPMPVAALIEPLSCAVHAYDLIRTKLGDAFLIYGAGTMGLMLISMAARVGAISVTVVEPNADRHQLASILGATEVVSTVEQLEEEGRFDLVIDATGVIEAIEDGVRRVRQGGTFLQFGVASSERMASFSPYRLYHDEVTFVGSMAVLNSFDRARDLAVDADLGLAQLVSDTLPLSSYSDPTSAAQLLDRDPAPL